jgi:hypothetical protein
MPAFPAGIAIRPLLTGNKTQTGILCLKFFYVDLPEIK